MIFATHIRNASAAKNYFSQHLAPGDYYGRDSQEMKGEWHGLGAELLGLSGEVSQKDYFKLCDNINPRTNKQLTPETKGTRRVLTDFTFDAPKSVSLALEFGGLDGKGDSRILEAFQQSIRETMAEMEQLAMTRVRKNNANHDRLTSNFVWLENIHRTARPVNGTVDLHLHCHATVMNATHDVAEDRWKAIQLGEIFRDKGLYQAKFHTRLSAKLRDLGYGIQRQDKSFALVDIDRSTVEKFSRRTAVIDAEAAKRGLTDPKAKADLGRKTRQKKGAEPETMAQLREEWKSRLTDDERRSLVDAGKMPKTTTLTAKEAMNFAVEHCFERNSVITQNELVRTALIYSVGNASIEDVTAQLQREDLIRRSKFGMNYVTTKKVRQEEMLMTAFAREGRGKHKKLGSAVRVDLLLSAEQQAAARKILSSRDAVTLLEGGAGTGKTRMMQATVKAIEKSKKKVFTFAPSADASRNVLVSENFKDADTVARLLMDEKLQKQTRGQVVWIDEAGLLSTPDMLSVFQLAKKQDFRLVLSGDTKQHHAVGRGDALRILKTNAGLKVATLSEVRRQINTDYRRAVMEISKGDALAKDGKSYFTKGLETLDKIGGIVEVDGEERHKQVAADYLAITAERKGKEFKTALVVSPTHAELEKVTQQIRDGLKKAKRIGTNDVAVTSLKSLGLTNAQRGDYANYQPGQVLKLTQNERNFIRGEKVRVASIEQDRLRVTRENGQAATLFLKDAARFDAFQAREIALAKGDKVRITQNGFGRETRPGVKNRLDNGNVFQIASIKGDDITLTNGFVVPKDYGFLTYGYATTSHASQGKTTDNVLIALGQQSFAAANKEQLYVSVSRGREGVKIYTDDKAEMLHAVKASSTRMSASELLDTPVRKPPLLERLFVMQRVKRAYESVRERIGHRQEVTRGAGY